MTFKRELEQVIKKKITNYQKPLMILGARQVGKTTLIKKVAEDYGDYVYVNLEQRPDISDLFNDSLDIAYIIMQIELLLASPITKDTLIIFDEIQSKPRAITSLKYFAEDSDYKVITTGSNLGVTLFETDSSFPVGKVDILNMYQLNFLEFLENTGNERLKDFLSTLSPNYKISDTIHELLLKQFDVFIELGGYPEVIMTYLELGYLEAIQTSKKLLLAYKTDITKYADINLTTRIRHIYDEIPAMLQQDNQKFRHTKIDKYGYKNLEYPMHWLVESGMVQLVHKVESAIIPLSSHIKENSFKALSNDTGLLLRQANYSSVNLKDQNEKIYFGLIIENYIGNVLSKYTNKLFYYHRNTTEIDYLFQLGTKVIPIEVKSGTNTKAKSLNVYQSLYNPELAIKVTRNNYSINQNFTNVPLYLFEIYLCNLLDAENKDPF